MKKITVLLLVLCLLLQTIGCAKVNSGGPVKNITGQKEIARINRYDSAVPENYKWFNYKEKALLYDNIIFDEDASGPYLPLIWRDKTNSTFGFAAYVGDARTGVNGSQEAVATVAAVLSAAQIGIDKSRQNGINYVEQLHAYYSEDEGIILNNPGGSSASTSMWYMIYPAILFTQVSLRYPQEEQIRHDALSTIERWYEAFFIMKETEGFNYTGFNFITMEPYYNGVWKEPDCAAGLALLFQMGYEMTGDEKYAQAVLECLDYLNAFDGSALYELLLYFAPGLAARMNALRNTDYDIDNFLGDVLNGNSIPRGGWGSIVGTWGDYNVNGLMGSTTDGGGYAFSMNTFAAGYALSSLAKYDTRYAKAMGIWYLNVSSNARYFFSGETDKSNQSASADKASQEFIKISKDAVPYEGIRRSSNTRTPWIGGDPTVYGWANTDLSLYSGAHIGLFASVVDKTDINKILKINCNAMDADADYAVWLLYNPYDGRKKVTYELPAGSWDLFNSVTKQVIAKDVSGEYELKLDADEAAVIIELPAGSDITHKNGNYYVNDLWIAADTLSVSINNLQNNEQVSGKLKLDLNIVSTDPENKPEQIIVEIDGTKLYYTDVNDVELNTEVFTEGSKNVKISVITTDNETDRTSIRLNFSR
jgi:hypothetical protein